MLRFSRINNTNDSWLHFQMSLSGKHTYYDALNHDTYFRMDYIKLDSQTKRSWLHFQMSLSGKHTYYLRPFCVAFRVLTDVYSRALHFLCILTIFVVFTINMFGRRFKSRHLFRMDYIKLDSQTKRSLMISSPTG